MRPRLPLEAALSDDRAPGDAELDAAMQAHDETNRNALEARGAPLHAWTATMAEMLAQPRRPMLAAFSRGKGAQRD